jgi:hypothetical protein
MLVWNSSNLSHKQCRSIPVARKQKDNNEIYIIYIVVYSCVLRKQCNKRRPIGMNDGRALDCPISETPHGTINKTDRLGDREISLQINFNMIYCIYDS